MKKLLILCLSFMLLGCTGIESLDLSEKVTISFYYIESCSECQAFKKIGIPYIENTFKDQIVINQYDLDDLSNEERYDKTLDALNEFDYDYYGLAPFIVVDNYFGVLGYTTGDEEFLVNDIKNAVEGKELSMELDMLRFYFK